MLRTIPGIRAALIAIGLSPTLMAQDTDTDGAPIQDRDRIQYGTQEGDGDPVRQEARSRLQDGDGLVDEDGDGTCDNCGGDRVATQTQARKRFRRGDVNDDGTVDVSDPVRLLCALFCGDDNPPPPFRNHGEDPTPDRLGCGE